jgi:hypothetical protein
MRAGGLWAQRGQQGRRVVLSPVTVPAHAGPGDDHGGRADRARLVVLAGQDGLAAVPAREEEIISSSCARQ